MLGPFFLKPPIDMFMVSNGNYGSCLEARLRDLIFCIFNPFWGGRRGQKLIFFNCGIHYHVIPQNVLLFFQKNNECVCFSKFSFFGQFYVHFWSKLTPFRLRNFSEIGLFPNIFLVEFRRHLRLKIPFLCEFYYLMWYWTGEGAILRWWMRLKFNFPFKIYNKILLAFFPKT